MYKYPVTILLILLVAAQSFSKWCLIAEFQVNREDIARNLCINRLNPVSCCKGTCFLTKRLADDERRQQTPAKGGQDEAPMQVHHPDIDLPAPAVHSIAVLHSTRYLDPAGQEYMKSCYNPPQVA
jgi:hypothetical protein